MTKIHSIRSGHLSKRRGTRNERHFVCPNVSGLNTIGCVCCQTRHVTSQARDDEITHCKMGRLTGTFWAILVVETDQTHLVCRRIGTGPHCDVVVHPVSWYADNVRVVVRHRHIVHTIVNGAVLAKFTELRRTAD